MQRLDRIRTELGEIVTSLDLAELSATDARSVLDGFMAIGKLADAGVVSVAHAVAAAEGCGVGATTRDLARSAGVSQAEAERMVSTSKALPSLPATRSALAAGELSRSQAAIVAEAAVDSPGSERGLLETARSQDMVGLRRHAERVKAGSGDEKQRRERAHANRSMSTWVRGGEWHCHPRSTVEAGARIMLAHQPFLDAALEANRKAGLREPFAAAGFDGMVAMTQAASSAGGEKLKKRRWQGVVRVDATAIRRGYATSDEICEIVGVGPIDVATATDLLGHATVRLLVKEGRDVLSVATATRYVPPELAVAVAEKGDWECANRTCSNTGWLERDHDDEYARTHDTSYCNLHWLCGRCHDRKTYEHHRVHEHDDGTITLLAPDDPDPP